MTRVLTAVALIPAVVWVVLFSGSWVFLAVLAAAACLSWREYNIIAGSYGVGRPGVLGYGLGLALLCYWDVNWFAITAVTVMLGMLALRERDLEHALPRAALLMFGVIYIFGCWKCARPIREVSPHWLMYALLLNWAGDIGAYYVGRTFGKHKLAPEVSPKKSWEGAAASTVTSILAGGIYLMKFLPAVPVSHVVGLTAVANIAGQMGDLAESAIKRGANVKDSGGILPGHGGFLDRVDSSLFALPVVYGYLLATT